MYRTIASEFCAQIVTEIIIMSKKVAGRVNGGKTAFDRVLAAW